MRIIKLSATDSTNVYLKNLMLSEPLADMTVVVADEQSKGRGQMGTKWVSDPGKNLTFSVLKKHVGLDVNDQFRLNICISLAIAANLKALQLPDIKIKWPNDILSGTSKVCGVLVENILLGNQIKASIIGIGLNVNQLDFNNLINVSSIKLLLGRAINLDELLLAVMSNLERNFFRLKEKPSYDLWRDYENLLFRKDRPSTFKNKKGEFFMGFIRGVSKEGRLMVALEDEVIKAFDLKEVKLMY
ncbi:MAG: biotin--[acetyl-CoA-carboxylase] ligase [Flavobacteriaceae bacterium]